MLFNPWRENKRLRQQVADLESTAALRRVVIELYRDRVANMHRRHPVTGRILPKGQ